MAAFLNLVADNLRERYGADMHNVNVVFPGKRARLFLNSYLVNGARQPVWTPAYYTLQELFVNVSPYSLITPIEAICMLFKAYKANMPGANDTLDQFYSWGEVLLSDFDDIDKHLVNAHLLFGNIEDLERLSSDDYLSDEQERTLRHFFSTFSKENNTLIRERFRAMWHAMPAIYDMFNAMMRECGRLTEGALYRDVIDRLQRGEAQLPEGEYAFVGFNALSDVEKRLMMYFKIDRKALFYWDYDISYKGRVGHEATIFMDENVTMFGNLLDIKHFDNLNSKDKTFTYIATAGAHGQTTYVPQWVKEHKCCAGIPDTAVVLCDESILEPVLHSIPDTEHGGPTTANITMGYPMTYTQVYSLVRGLLSLHTDGWNRTSRRMRTNERRIVERNPLICDDVKNGTLDIRVHEDGSRWLVKYIQGMLEFVSGRNMQRLIENNGGKPIERTSVTPEQALLSESLYRAYTTLATLAELVSNGTLDVDTPCLAKIIDQALSRVTIPFKGEPAEGLQVMGVLETRCLDFDNLLMLSVGEGHMPKNDRLPSFIPYSLRAPFNLTTIEHRVGIHAYNFYRLIQRAKNITFVYDTACSDGVKNEMSRFLRQLLVEMRPGGVFPDKALMLKPNLSVATTVNLSAEKTAAVIDKLTRDVERFTPTALEEYISCPLQYYLHYIGGVKEYEEQEDEMDAATFGKIFHDSAEHIYNGFKGAPLTADKINYYLNGKVGERELANIVEGFMYTRYMEPRGMARDMVVGNLSIRRDVIVGYLQSLLRYDLKCVEQETIEVVGCEKDVTFNIALPSGRTVAVGGIIDRLDCVTDAQGNKRWRIVDYKTMSRGEDKPSANTSIDHIFIQKKKFHRHIFQTFLYGLAIEDRSMPIQPTVFYTQDSLSPNYTANILFGGGVLIDMRQYADDFQKRLAELIDEIFDTNKPFVPTEDSWHCTYCPFKDICRKQ